MSVRDPDGAIGHTGTDDPERLRLLLAANRTLVEELDLTEVLKRIVEVAVDVIGARYGAIGVFGEHDDLEVFIHTGMSDDAVAAIDHLPEGRGLLGDLLDGGPAILLDDVREHVHFTGFPPNHPPMRSFLGIGLEVRGRVYGNLYLTDSDHEVFTAEDADAARMLAETAGVAIANARLYDESRRREAWTAASAEVTNELLAADGVDPLELVAVRVGQIAEATVVAVVLPGRREGELVVARAAGEGADALVGLSFVPTGQAAGETPSLLTVEDLTDVLGLPLPLPSGAPAMAVPLGDAANPLGVLVAARATPPGFDETDLVMAQAFAGQAGLALGKRELREAREEMMILEDRDRIARDLHDHVIQRLFASGLTLQSVLATMPPGAARDRLGNQIGELDETIRQIRSTIFELHDTGDGPGGVRRRLSEAAAQGARVGDPEVRLHVEGPVDLMSDPYLAADVMAVAREGIANARRHAHATRIDVRVAVHDGTVVVEVRDDGGGIPDGAPRSGLANLERRARDRGGRFEVRTGDLGTTLVWTVDIDEEEQT